MANRLTINCDMDGVVYDFATAMHERAEDYLGRNLPLSQSWDMGAAWGLSRDEFYELFHRAIEDLVFEDGQPVEGAVEAIETLRRKHRIRIVTSKLLRYPESTLRAQMQTLRFLHRHGLNDLEVAFAHNKQGYEADVVIDDKPTLKWAQHGATNLLFARRWNTEDKIDRQVARMLGVVRVEGWDEVLELVDRLAMPLRRVVLEDDEVGAGGL